MTYGMPGEGGGVRPAAMIRGGGYLVERAEPMRAAGRDWCSPVRDAPDIGFRCVYD